MRKHSETRGENASKERVARRANEKERAERKTKTMRERRDARYVYDVPRTESAEPERDPCDGGDVAMQTSVARKISVIKREI